MTDVLRVSSSLRTFWCPGCQCCHVTDLRWTWNGDRERPTLSPSVLVKFSHPLGHANENPAPVGYDGPYVTEICHSFVRDGEIQYLSDCTHGLAGQTVPMERASWWDDWEKEGR